MRSLLLLLVSLSANPAVPAGPPTIAEASAAVVELREHRDEVDALYDAYVRGRQPVLAQCVSGPAADLRVLADLAERALSDMKSAGEGSERAASEGRKVRVAISRARALHQQAEACAGVSSAETLPLEVEGPEGEDGQIDAGNKDLGTDPPGVTPFE